MLISKAQIEKACNLTVDELNAAMVVGGYTDTYDTAEFLGLNQTGSFVYKVVGFDNVEGEDIEGRVYLKFVRDAFSDQFYLKGDY